MPPEAMAAFNLQRFQSLRALIRIILACLLRVSLGGTSWQERASVMPVDGRTLPGSAAKFP